MLWSCKLAEFVLLFQNTICKLPQIFNSLLDLSVKVWRYTN